MDEQRIVVALAGNPNVGKTTIFNALTGRREPTGNWSGTTITAAQGIFQAQGQEYLLVDLPGIYSLSAPTENEQIARDFISSSIPSILLVVCDAACLEQGLCLLKQILSLDYIKSSRTPVVLCLNLYDEAIKRGILIDLSLLHDVLQIPVLSSCARCQNDIQNIKQALSLAEKECFHYDCLDFSPKHLARETMTHTKTDYCRLGELLDRIITQRFCGPAFMLLILTGIFWLSITGAAYPSTILWNLLFWLEKRLEAGLLAVHTPVWLISALIYGIYRMIALVLSIIFPPMVVFFPLFTLLEDFGLLPRAAFHTDHAFEKCSACGKQCMTMGKGLSCNAEGVMECRIINSRRERLIAIITSSLVPCNGRLSTLFILIPLFFTASISNPAIGSFLSSLFLTSVILIVIAFTLGASWLLSHTLLKGAPSFFTLELPPYRQPQIGKAILHSAFDRTLFILSKAVTAAAPAGLILWLLANISYTGPENGWFAFFPQLPGLAEKQAAFSPIFPYSSLLSYIIGFLTPLGNAIGLDGVILTAFILSFPARELLLPIIFTIYLQSVRLAELSGPSGLFTILSAHGWTSVTILCTLILCLFHWPCLTTILTTKKETGSLKWTTVSILLPTIIGIGLCTLIAILCQVIG
ncbi:ferrous iron transporter B [Lachnospiraceae bacterium 62-35]